MVCNMPIERGVCALFRVDEVLISLISLRWSFTKKAKSRPKMGWSRYASMDPLKIPRYFG